MARIVANVPLRWSDMDAFGHVNNAVFLRILEDARVIAFEATGSEHGGSLLDTGVLVSRHEIDYINPLKFRHAPIRVAMWTTELGGASFDMQYEVYDGEEVADPVVYAQAESTLVVFDLATQKPRRMTDAERITMASWGDEPLVLRKAKRASRRSKA